MDLQDMTLKKKNILLLYAFLAMRHLFTIIEYYLWIKYTSKYFAQEAKP